MSTTSPDSRLTEIQRRLDVYRATPTEEITRQTESGVSPQRLASVRKHYGEVFSEWPTLLQQGHLVWGWIVMANDELYRHRDRTSMGYAMLSPESRSPDWERTLHAASSRLHSLSDPAEPQDAGEQQWHDWLTTALGNPPSIPLPSLVSHRADVRVVALGIAAQHLPGGSIGEHFLPMLWHETAHTVMIVPKVFWPEEMVAEHEECLLAQRHRHREEVGERFAALPRAQRLRLGLGAIFGKSGLSLLFTAKPLLFFTALSFFLPSVVRYHLQKEPLPVTSAAELTAAGDSRWVTTEGALDLTRAVKRTVKDRTKMLAPVAGTEPPLWVSANDVTGEAAPGHGQPTRLSGAVENLDSFLYSEFRDAAAAQGRPLAPGTRILAVRRDPMPAYAWGLLIATVLALLATLWFLRRLAKALRYAFLTNPQHLTDAQTTELEAAMEGE